MKFPWTCVFLYLNNKEQVASLKNFFWHRLQTHCCTLWERCPYFKSWRRLHLVIGKKLAYFCT